MGMLQSSLRFSAHEMHLFALYDELRRSGEVKTMLHSDVIRKLNERQDLGDKSDHGPVKGSDIDFVMANFTELRKCRSRAVLIPEQPPPKLTVNTDIPPVIPQAEPRKKKRKRHTSPLSSALTKMRRKGYLCRSRFRGNVPSEGDYVLLTAEEQDKWRKEGETSLAFHGDRDYLQQMLGDTVEVSPIIDGRLAIRVRVDNVSVAEDEVQPEEEKPQENETVSKAVSETVSETVSKTVSETVSEQVNN